MIALRAIAPMLIPIGFAWALKIHLSHPWLPPAWGDLPYREAVLVQFAIWSFYCLAAARWRHNQKRVACHHCGDDSTVERWRDWGGCPHCGFDQFRQVGAAADVIADPGARSRVKIAPTKALALSGEQKERVRGRLRLLEAETYEEAA